MRHLYRLIAFLVFVGLIPYLAFDVIKWSPVADYPLVFVLGIWAIALFWRGITLARRKEGGALAFNLGFLCLALGAVELWIGMSSGIAKHMVASPPRAEYVAHHDALGYAPIPDRAWRFAAESEGDEVYDVTYTIDAKGLRASPPPRDPPAEGSVVCFGCSFTFGSGIEDDETFPWRLEEELDGALHAYNFGFSGYGPHQMLANLRSGRVEKIIESPPRHVIYLAIPDHARRVAGAAVHDRRGPRFVLEDDGTVRRDGNFSQNTENALRKRLFQFMNHSHLGQAITRRFSRGEGDVELMAGVVAASKEAVLERWPDSRFHVILWNDRPTKARAVEDALRARGIDVWLASDMLPGFEENAQQHRLHRADEHPSPAAVKIMAHYVATQILTAPAEPGR